MSLRNFVLICSMFVAVVVAAPIAEPTSDSSIESSTNSSTVPDTATFTPSPIDVSHLKAIERQNAIMKQGEAVSMGITQTLLTPLFAFNNRISQAAATLPGLFSAQGAALGSAIAAPIQFTTMAANGLASGITGTLVSIPVSMATVGIAQAAGALESGRQFYQTMPDLGQLARAQQNLSANGGGILQQLALIPASLPQPIVPITHQGNPMLVPFHGFNFMQPLPTPTTLLSSSEPSTESLTTESSTTESSTLTPTLSDSVSVIPSVIVV